MPKSAQYVNPPANAVERERLVAGLVDQMPRERVTLVDFSLLEEDSIESVYVVLSRRPTGSYHFPVEFIVHRLCISRDGAEHMFVSGGYHWRLGEALKEYRSRGGTV